MEPPRASSPPSVRPSSLGIQRVRGHRRARRPMHRCLTCGDIFRSLPHLRVHQSLNHSRTRAIACGPWERSSYEQRAQARSAALRQLSHILDYFYQQRISNRGRGRSRRQETENNCPNPSGSAPRYGLQTGATTMFWAGVTRTSTMPTPFLEAGQAAAIPNHCLANHCVPALHLNDTNFGSRNWVPQLNPDHGAANSVTCPRTNLVLRGPVSAPMLVGRHRDADYMDVLLRSLAYSQPVEANTVRDSAVEANPQGLDLNLHL
ncbi:hypothetical protein COCNU_01G011720 [Cocos nucifera]|uniref:C2H2-type domain-containing protein n=1 Tax=Cocos nucifera TaxID=13894 RepID=A0A8K0MV48_COCNU|nr:hypothetical protein COCNU_01G011720 [Cocos nucifera]